MEMTLTKRLDDMSVEELLAFKERYIAMTTAAPALIEQVLADDEANEEQRQQTEEI
jgi:ribosomal protein L12E/L44/L45/RPP1/RPP2